MAVVIVATPVAGDVFQITVSAETSVYVTPTRKNTTKEMRQGNIPLPATF
jgi:hypothetical protein